MINQKTKFKQTEIGLIPEEWEVKKIKEIGKVICGKTPPTSNKIYFGGKYPFIRIPDMGKSVFVNDSELYLSEEGAQYMKKLRLPPKAVMVSCLATIGQVGITTKESFTNQQINSIIPYQDKIISEWIYYFFKFNKQYLESFGGGGSVYTNISKSKFENIELVIPPLPEQRAIAKILSDLDSKIELNQQMNKTLEAIGQALFKRWFVDFEFPNEEGKPYKSSGGEMVYNAELGREIPKGWRVVKLGDLITKNRKPIKNYDDWKDKDLIDLSNMPHFSISITNFDKGKRFRSNIFELEELDILFGSIRPYFGKYGFSPINGAITGTIYSLKPKNKQYYSFILNIICRKEFVNYTTRLSEGTKMPIIRWNDFSDFDVVLPIEEKIIINFQNIIFPTILKIKNNTQEILSLQKIRDLLLPKLMSGKIRVPVEVKT